MSRFQLDNVICGYDKHPVLKGISFTLEPGDFAGVIGPNGSGKSTLVKAMTGYLPLSGGSVTLDRLPIPTIPLKDLARRVAVVGQFLTTPQDLLVEELVALGRLPHRERWQFFDSEQDRNRIQEAMDWTGVTELRHRSVTELSGGERQAVAVARALAQEPQVLLLDEPTAHLDIGHQVKLLDLLKRLNRDKGLTVLVVLHDLNLAAEYCDRLFLLHQGRLAAQGAPEAVLTYQTLEAVYETVVVVGPSPVSGKPVVHPVSETWRHSN